MRSTLLASAAFCTVLLATPVLPPPGPKDAGRSASGPMELAAAICRSRAPSGAPALRARFIAAAAAYAATTGDPAASVPPPLIDGVASQALTATVSDAARPYFEQGMGLVDGFNHAEAIRAFHAAQALDPNCALCFWGEAYALGPNINKVMDPADNARALEAAKLALAKTEGATEVERALIEAIQSRYSADPTAERPALDAAYSAAMQAVADRFPDAPQVQALAAEAIMDTQPWDYWEPGGQTPKGNAGVALARIEKALATDPDNVLAIHLHIHLTEASDDPWRSAPYAAKLGALAPGAGHLVHMPAHTWYRIGRFEESLATNVAAVAVDDAYLAEAGAAVSPIYRYGYYPHNLHFVLTSAQMAGDAATALDMGGKLDAALPMEMADLEGWIQYIKAGAMFAAVQFGDPARLEAVLAAPRPDGAPPLIEAAWRYARGEAAARLGQPHVALAEEAALAELDAATDWGAAAPWTPAADVVQIMRRLVIARAALAGGDLDSAIAALEKARDIQAMLPYTEPPFWWYPVRQTLGAALLMDGQAGRAEHEFTATLVESPRNAWAYWGLAQARAAQGDTVGAEAATALWREGWLGEAPPTLDRL